MATTPTVPPVADIPALVEQIAQRLNISATTDIGAVANCIAEVAKTLQTPEGQATMKAWRDNAVAFSSAIDKAWSGFLGLFK